MRVPGNVGPMIDKVADGDARCQLGLTLPR